MFRMLNTECIFLDFFDGHDIWHFLGGSGMLSGFFLKNTVLMDMIPGISLEDQVIKI